MAADDYIINVAWLGASRVAARVMPRIQNTWTLYAVSATDGTSTSIGFDEHPQYLEPVRGCRRH